MIILCPDAMSLEALRLQHSEGTSWPTLQGLFAAFRHGDLSRASLIEAIRDWQITEAKEAKL
jgi:hypothetical protein